MKFKNSKGSIFYGMHFYPGVAEYSEPGKEVQRVFLNESTIRSMDPSFAGRPVFVFHVDEVEKDIDRLRGEADGWVVESFFNAADGKHWVKFIVTSEDGEKAIRAGFRLSNAYVAKSLGQGGLWNGVAYNNEITSGEYEHLALVSNPRYDESVIMTPEQFKKYNEEQKSELLRLANSKTTGDSKMKLSFFKREKIENGFDLEATMVTLPKSKKEKSLSTIINEWDDMESKKNEAMADGEHHVMVGKEKMKLNDLVKKHEECMNELAKMKENAAPGVEEETEFHDEMGDDDMMNSDEEDKKALAAADAKEKDAMKKNSKGENFNKLKNASSAPQAPTPVEVDLPVNQVARGLKRYGSN